MSQGLNKVMILGNLGADPELRYTQAGQAVLNMRIACTESYLDKDKVRQERTEWINVVVWGPRAEGLAKFLKKGASLFVEGSLRTSSYEDREGGKRYKTEVTAHNIVLTGGRRDGTETDESDGGTGEGTSARRAQNTNAGAADDGDFVVAFGRDKGNRISQIQDLSWLRGKLAADLADASKARFHDKGRRQIASIDAELRRRGGDGAPAPAARGAGGGNGYSRGAPPPQAAPAAEPDESDYEGGGGYEDGDIPF